MATSCFITDYTRNERSALFFRSDDYSEVIEAWDKQDSLLVELSEQLEMFDGVTRWCDLDPLHWQLILATHFRTMDGLSTEDQNDYEHPTVASFHRMIMGLVMCLEARCEYGHIDTINVTRTGELDCSYQIVMTMMAIRSKGEEESPKPSFKVVVDNS